MRKRVSKAQRTLQLRKSPNQGRINYSADCGGCFKSSEARRVNSRTTKLCTAIRATLPEYVLYVRVDRVVRDAQQTGNLNFRQVTDDHLCDLGFALGQPQRTHERTPLHARQGFAAVNPQVVTHGFFCRAS